MQHKSYCIILLSIFIEGCSFVGTKIVEPESNVNPSVAYIYGYFYVKEEKDTISTINLVQSPKIVYLISDLTEQKANGYIVLTSENAIKAIPIKPGKYAFGKMLYTSKGSISRTKSLVKEDVIEDLQPNKAYYIGNYIGNTKAERTGGGTIYSWNVSNVTNNFITTTNEFLDKYKNFTNIDKIDLTTKLGIN